MGIKLDWQVETEHVHKRVGEDPRERRRRRGRRFRVILFTCLLFGLLAAGGGLIAFRLYTVDNQIRQNLIDTVQAETAALRIGDYAGYMNIQRSASDNWIKAQSERYHRYQELKTTNGLRLTGNVLDATVDGSRGRVVVEEALEGVSYRTVWFYWRYNDGWRHVPSDFTFWGDSRTLDGKATSVKYRGLDAQLAESLAARLDQWWAAGCEYTGCATLQRLTLEIIPNPALKPRWDESKPLTLVIPSPLAAEERALPDLSPALEDEIAAMVAEWLFNAATNHMVPVQVADSAWLRRDILDWMTSAFTGRVDASKVGFIQSLHQNYGSQTLAALIHSLSPTSDIRILSTLLNQPIETLLLDWRAFFQWRLDVEKTLLMRNDLDSLNALWDTTNPAALNLLRQRIAYPTQPTAQVEAVAIAAGSDGIARASVQAAIETKPVVIIFKLVDGVWKRSAS